MIYNPINYVEYVEYICELNCYAQYNCNCVIFFFDIHKAALPLISCACTCTSTVIITDNVNVMINNCNSNQNGIQAYIQAIYTAEKTFSTENWG